MFCQCLLVCDSHWLLLNHTQSQTGVDLSGVYWIQFELFFFSFLQCPSAYNFIFQIFFCTPFLIFSFYFPGHLFLETFFSPLFGFHPFCLWAKCPFSLLSDLLGYKSHQVSSPPTVFPLLTFLIPFPHPTAAPVFIFYFISPPPSFSSFSSFCRSSAHVDPVACWVQCW